MNNRARIFMQRMVRYRHGRATSVSIGRLHDNAVFDDFNGQNRTVSHVPADPEADLISIADVSELESDYALRRSVK